MAALRVNEERSREELDYSWGGLVDYKLRSNYGNGSLIYGSGSDFTEM
jgi:hypothetical protein